MKIYPVRAEMSHAGGRSGGRPSRFLHFC